MASRKKIKLEFHKHFQSLDENGHRWKVLQVVNSTEFNPGEKLEKAKVEWLCHGNSGWEVTIVPKGL